MPFNARSLLLTDQQFDIHTLLCLRYFTLLLPTTHHGMTRTVWLPCRSPPWSLSLRCHLAALTLFLRLGYRMFQDQSQKIGILNNWPSNTPGSIKYFQPTTV